MKKSLMSLLVMVGIVMLVGCDAGTNQVLPTLIPTLEDTEVPTPTSDITEAPTATPLDLDRPTLPPTWTVSPVPSETATPTIDATAQAQSVKPTLVVCGVFAIDRDRSPTTYTPGSPVTVYWVPVDTAARYRVRLVSETGDELFTDYALDPTYTFDPKLFNGTFRYAWQVYPEDGLNQQMCFERGGDLLPPA